MSDIMPFDEWEQMLVEAEYPNVAEACLALNTLRICLSDIQIDKETENIDEDTFKIAEDGYALFDYAMFCYFLFRARLCSDFPRQFVERYDTFVQNLLPIYFDCCFDISQETIKRLITSRAIEYEKLAASQNDVTTKEMIETLVDFMIRDFYGEPECKEVVITNFHSQCWVTIKVTNYVKITFEALEREIKPILCRDTVKEFPKINPKAIQTTIKKQEGLKRNEVWQKKPNKSKIVSLIKERLKKQKNSPNRYQKYENGLFLDSNGKDTKNTRQ